MKKKILTLFLIIAFTSLLTKTSLAKYAYKKINNLYFESHNFYFDSDKLGIDNKYSDTLWDGKSVHFNLSNSFGDKVFDQDINYEVECVVLNNDVPCNLNGTGKNKITGTLSHSEKCINELDDIDTSNYNKTECELHGYKWSKSVALQDLYFDVTLDNAVVKITATSIYPYKKELTSTFTLIKNVADAGSLKKELNDLEDSTHLIITNTYEEKKCVLVEFDNNKTVVDVENNMFDIKSSGEYVNSFKVNIDGKSNKKLVFYKKNKDDKLSTDNYKVSVSSGCS